jgi:hypothetical protein
VFVIPIGSIAEARDPTSDESTDVNLSPPRRHARLPRRHVNRALVRASPPAVCDISAENDKRFGGVSRDIATLGFSMTRACARSRLLPAPGTPTPTGGSCEPFASNRAKNPSQRCWLMVKQNTVKASTPRNDGPRFRATFSATRIAVRLRVVEPDAPKRSDGAQAPTLRVG